MVARGPISGFVLGLPPIPRLPKPRFASGRTQRLEPRRRPGRSCNAGCTFWRQWCNGRCTDGPIPCNGRCTMLMDGDAERMQVHPVNGRPRARAALRLLQMPPLHQRLHGVPHAGLGGSAISCESCIGQASVAGPGVGVLRDRRGDAQCKVRDALVVGTLGQPHQLSVRPTQLRRPDAARCRSSPHGLALSSHCLALSTGDRRLAVPGEP